MNSNYAEQLPQKPLPLHELNASSGKSALSFDIHAFSPEKSLTGGDLPHRHNFYQILYITAGKGLHIIDFEPYPIQPLELYFISPEQIHFWQTEIIPQGYVILFTCDFLLFDSLSPYGFNKLAFFHNINQTPQLQLTTAQAAPIAALIETLEQEYRSREFNQVSVLSAYLHILLAKIQRLYASSDISPNLAHDSVVVRRFKQLVSAHFLTERSVRAYADKIGISAGHLTEMVKTVTGQTPGQIIRQTLTLEAKRLLVNTNLTVEQLSYQLAFDDPAYFGRLFKRETGLSPGRFRRYIREKYQISPN